jgi:arylsulfatase A-like enzyme
VVLTADHGEEMLERGGFGHGGSVHEELLHVPLILRVPGRAPAVVDRQVMLLDVAPTCLALLGLAREPRMQGVDLFGPDWPNRPIWSEVDVAQKNEQTVIRALREEDGWKVLQSVAKDSGAAGVELYDLNTDPRETQNLAKKETARRDELLERLNQAATANERLGASLGNVGTGVLDEDTLEDLRNLGYIR